MFHYQTEDYKRVLYVAHLSTIDLTTLSAINASLFYQLNRLPIQDASSVSQDRTLQMNANRERPPQAGSSSARPRRGKSPSDDTYRDAGLSGRSLQDDDPNRHHQHSDERDHIDRRRWSLSREPSFHRLRPSNRANGGRGNNERRSIFDYSPFSNPIPVNDEDGDFIWLDGIPIPNRIYDFELFGPRPEIDLVQHVPEPITTPAPTGTSDTPLLHACPTCSPDPGVFDQVLCKYLGIPAETVHEAFHMGDVRQVAGGFRFSHRFTASLSEAICWKVMAKGYAVTDAELNEFLYWEPMFGE